MALNVELVYLCHNIHLSGACGWCVPLHGVWKPQRLVSSLGRVGRDGTATAEVDLIRGAHRCVKLYRQ